MLTRQKYIVHGRLKKNGDVRRVPGTPVSYERTLKHKKPSFAVMKKYIHKLFPEPEASRSTDASGSPAGGEVPRFERGRAAF